MKQIIIEIPDDKLTFFSELLKNLGVSAKVHVSDITETQKDFVRDRINTATPDTYISIDELEKRIKF